MPQTPRLEVGDKAPAFSLPDADGNTVKLSDYNGRKVIVYFYPAASTPGCTKQACDFRDSLSKLNGAGLDVVGRQARLAAAQAVEVAAGDLRRLLREQLLAVLAIDLVLLVRLTHILELAIAIDVG